MKKYSSILSIALLSFFIISVLCPACSKDTDIQTNEEVQEQEKEVQEQEEEGQETSDLVKNLSSAGAYIGEVHDLNGTVEYAPALNLWTIRVVTENTIDEVDNYYPVTIRKQFLSEHSSVQFSGKVYHLDEQTIMQIPRLGGSEYYAIEINSMAKVEQ